MDNRKWFMLFGEEVRGPYDMASVTTELQKQPQALIWGRGQTDWLLPDQWYKSLQEHDAAVERARAQMDREWRIRLRGQELEPMLYSQMIDFLKTQNDYAEIMIWTEGYTEWKEIYQIHKILDDLGVSRRRNPRVPIMGQVEFENPQGSFGARALSISEGGLGVTDAPVVRIGDRFKMTLKSPNLFGPLHATAEVVFVGEDGYVGLKFFGLPIESKSAVIEYVKRFTEGQVKTGTSTNIL